jgi:hypothetical protein
VVEGQTRRFDILELRHIRSSMKVVQLALSVAR